MKIPAPLHRWTMPPCAAIRLQRRLAGRVRVEPLRTSVRFVAGADLTFSPDGVRYLAGVVVFDLQYRRTVEEVIAWRPVRFPYVPGLLSFRETPAVLAAVRKLQVVPDVFMFDAHGLAHPRRLDLASHAGLLMDRPSIGCAKSRLCGRHPDPSATRGRSTRLEHNGETIGIMLRTRAGMKPVYVSAGHRVTLQDARNIVLRYVDRYRLPEPTKRAHILATRHRQDR